MRKILLTLTILSPLLLGCVLVNSKNEVLTNSEPAEQEKLTEPVELPQQAKVPILIYHHIRQFKDSDSANDKTFVVFPENFKQQMDYLVEQKFNSISFANLVDYFLGKFKMPEKPVIITFDDGVINQYENAWPVLKENNLTATFFIFSNPIGRSANYMNWEQLQELAEQGNEIGGHGWYHLYLDRISKAELEKEIIESKKILEEKLGQEIKIFTYPFGQYNEEVVAQIKAAGYLAARGINNGVTHRPDDLYYLDGYFITNDFSRFKAILNK